MEKRYAYHCYCFDLRRVAGTEPLVRHKKPARARLELRPNAIPDLFFARGSAFRVGAWLPVHHGSDRNGLSRGTRMVVERPRMVLQAHSPQPLLKSNLMMGTGLIT